MNNYNDGPIWDFLTKRQGGDGSRSLFKRRNARERQRMAREAYDREAAKTGQYRLPVDNPYWQAFTQAYRVRHNDPIEEIYMGMLPPVYIDDPRRQQPMPLYERDNRFPINRWARGDDALDEWQFMTPNEYNWYMNGPFDGDKRDNVTRQYLYDRAMKDMDRYNKQINYDTRWTTSLSNQ